VPLALRLAYAISGNKKLRRCGGMVKHCWFPAHPFWLGTGWTSIG
jgi:hypothetical protein